jgi:hypothetical protein
MSIEYLAGMVFGLLAGALIGVSVGVRLGNWRGRTATACENSRTGGVDIRTLPRKDQDRLRLVLYGAARLSLLTGKPVELELHLERPEGVSPDAPMGAEREAT